MATSTSQTDCADDVANGVDDVAEQRQLFEIAALSPLDGRYASKVRPLRQLFSEWALIGKRVFVEVEWFKFLLLDSEMRSARKGKPESKNIGGNTNDDVGHLNTGGSKSGCDRHNDPEEENRCLSPEALACLEEVKRVSKRDALRVKEIEKTVNHDVKAVEYFLKEKLRKANHMKELEDQLELIHLFCTSEDINNLSLSLMLKEALERVLAPAMLEIVRAIASKARQHSKTPLLSRTHGQPATPTTFGKEMANFAHRLHCHVVELCPSASTCDEKDSMAQDGKDGSGTRDKSNAFPVDDIIGSSKNGRSGVRSDETENPNLKTNSLFLGKFNGAVGNFNAHSVAMPTVDWPRTARRFVEEKIGLTYQPYSTQIECHDFIARLCHVLIRFNTSLIDFSADMWNYISRDLLTLKMREGEVGSSTMPHKVNPIDFENAEGNLGLANALLGYMSSKLPISRLQRDLTDSTVLRNLGVAFGHCAVAYESARRGMEKVQPNAAAMLEELRQNWTVLAEAMQCILRLRGVEGAYEAVKSLTRGKAVDEEMLHDFLSSQSERLTPDDRKQLLALRPETYLGCAARLAEEEAERLLSDI